MKASTKRNVVRYLHLGVGSLLATYIYSPLGEIPVFQFVTKAIIIPLTILSGIWLWKGHLLKKYFNKSNVVSILLVTVISASAPLLFGFKNSDMPTLTLKINDVKKSGKIYVSFCVKQEEWSANGKYHFVYTNPTKGTNVYNINSIPLGAYSIAIFQDLNGNGKLDENMFGAPIEPFAFSNNIVPKFSAPKFEECKFTFSKSNQVISINLIN